MSPQVSPRTSQSTTPALDNLLSGTGLPVDQINAVKQAASIAFSQNPEAAGNALWELAPEPQKAQVRSYKKCGIATSVILVSLVVVQLILGILTMTRSIPPTYAGLLLFGTSALILAGCSMGVYKGYSVYQQWKAPKDTQPTKS